MKMKTNPNPTPRNLIGNNGRLFADPHPGADENTFQVDNTSSAYFNSPYYLLHQKQLQPVPPPRISPPIMKLVDVVGTAMINQIQAAKKFSFHAMGDTGAAKVSASQSAATAISHEGSVADAIAADVQQAGSAAPAFFFPLGDVGHYFGAGHYSYRP